MATCGMTPAMVRNMKASRNPSAAFTEMTRTPQSKGPRSVKWQREFKAKMRRLKTLPPGGAEFNETVKRLSQLSRLLGYRGYWEVLERVSVLLDPALMAKAEEIRPLLEEEGRNVTLGVRATRYANGWFFKAFVAPRCDSALIDQPTADTLQGQVADVLRREAAALTAMADRLEKRKPAKARAV